MERKRTLVMNLAVIGVVLLLALLTLALPRLLPERNVTPNAGMLEDAGFTFTPADESFVPDDQGGNP